LHVTSQTRPAKKREKIIMSVQLLKSSLLRQPSEQAIFPLLVIIYRRTFSMHDTIRWAHNLSWNATMYYVLCKENSIRRLQHVKNKISWTSFKFLDDSRKSKYRTTRQTMKHADGQKDLKCHLQKPLQCTATPYTHQTKAR
jgi:hypothetical protein